MVLILFWTNPILDLPRHAALRDATAGRVRIMNDFNQQYRDGLMGRDFSGDNFYDREMHRQGREKRFSVNGAGSPASGGGGGGIFALVALVLGALAAPFAVILAAIAHPVLAYRLRRRGTGADAGDVLRSAIITAFAVIAVHAVILVYPQLSAIPGDDPVADNLLWFVLVTEALAWVVAGFTLHRLLGGSFRLAATDAALAFILPATLMGALLASGYTVGTPPSKISLGSLLWGTGLSAGIVAFNIGLLYALIVKFVFRRPFGTAVVTAFATSFAAGILSGVIVYFSQDNPAQIISLVLAIALCRTILRWEGAPTKWWHRLPAAIILGSASWFAALSWIDTNMRI